MCHPGPQWLAGRQRSGHPSSLPSPEGGHAGGCPGPQEHAVCGKHFRSSLGSELEESQQANEQHAAVLAKSNEQINSNQECCPASSVAALGLEASCCILSTVFCRDWTHLRASPISSAVKKGRSCSQPNQCQKQLQTDMKRRLSSALNLELIGNCKFCASNPTRTQRRFSAGSAPTSMPGSCPFALSSHKASWRVQDR